MALLTPQVERIETHYKQLTGCDSIVTLILTINNAVNGDTTAIACDSLVWQGTTYNTTDCTTTHYKLLLDVTV